MFVEQRSMFQHTYIIRKIIILFQLLEITLLKHILYQGKTRNKENYSTFCTKVQGKTIQRSIQFAYMKLCSLKQVCKIVEM